MRPRHRFLIIALALVALAPIAAAQDDSETAPLTLGDFNLQGSVTGGYRFETLYYPAGITPDSHLAPPEFRELFDLGRGFRVMDVSLFGESQDGKNPFADSFSLQLSNLGGDPFPSAQFTVSKKKLYDLRVNWRQSYLFWNQNDNTVLPIVSVAPALKPPTGKTAAGLTSNQDWATVRKFGSVDFTLHATNNLRFTFEYYRTSDDGTTFTTRSLDFLDSPGYWGTFARANPYYLFAPLADETNRFSGVVDYTWHSWSFHYSIGYQTFTENMSLNNAVPLSVGLTDGLGFTVPGLIGTSINPNTTATVPLTSLSWSQFRRLTTPISEFSFVGKPLKKLEWRGGYIFYRYQGPATLDQAIDGSAPNSAGTPTQPYTLTQSGSAMLREPDNIVSQGLTYHFFDWWSADVDYRYSRFSSNAIGNFESLFQVTTPAPATTVSTEATDVVWRDGLSDLDISMDFTPIKGLTIRPGIQLMKYDVESLQDGVVQAPITLRTKIARPEISVGYEPSKLFSIRGDFHSQTSGAEYTAITPHTEQGAHFVVRVNPTEKISIEDDAHILNDRLITTNFKNNVRANAITVSYSLSDRLSVYGGFSYESLFAQGNVDYVRGTAPLTDFLRDQELNRVWQGGIELKPAKRVGLRLTGNFDRSSGVGAIFGVPPATAPANYNEPPAYGPVSWPLITGSGYYDFPIAGRLSVDLERTYYSQQIVPVNNFGANLLTIKWTRNF
ncbi:MAG TPA: hypothetical protein VEJ38_05975 [Candidatus Acidoferrales bacterium]|nr:hypothetical protein [Candidatus Acidoferrales bacterium]